MPASIVLTTVFGSMAAATATLGVLGVAAATFAINVVASYVVSSLFLKNQSGSSEQQQANPGSRVQLPPATSNKLPISYGTAWLKPIITDAKISTDQKTMWYVLTFSEVSDTATSSSTRPSFGTIRWGDKTLNFDPSDVTKVVSYTNDAGETETNISGKIYVYRYQDGSNNPQYGTPASAITILQNSEIPSIDRWSSTDVMTKTCFLIIKVNYDQEAGLTGLDEITAQVINPITKPGDVFVDYLTNERYGCGIASGQINTDQFTNLNSYSDQLITYNGSSTKERYRINGMLDTNQSCYQNLMIICDNCDSWLQWNESIGKWGVIINKAYDQSAGTQSAQLITDLFNITDDNVIGSINLNPVDLNATFNRVEVTYPDTNIYDQTYNAYIDLDAADRNPNEPDNVYNLTLHLTNDNVRAKYLGTRKLIQSREDLMVQCTLDYSGIQIDAGDLIRFNSDKFQWVDKVFRVSQVVENKDDSGFLSVQLTMMEYNAQVYQNIDITQFIPSPNTGISDPNIATTPNEPTISDIITTSVIPSFTLNVDIPVTGTYGGLELWYAKGTSSSGPSISEYKILKTLLPPTTNTVYGSFVGGATISHIVTQLDGSTLDTPYYFRARLITTTGRKSNYSDDSISFAWLPNPTATVVGQNFQTKFEPAPVTVSTLGNGSPDIANITFRLYGLVGPGQVDFNPGISNASLLNNQWRIDYGNMVSSGMTISNPIDGGAHALWATGSVTAMSGNIASLTVPVFYKDNLGNVYPSPPSVITINVIEKGAQGERGTYSIAYIPVNYDPTTATDTDLTNSFLTITGYTPIDGDGALFFNATTNVSSGRKYSSSTTPLWQYATLEVPGSALTEGSITETKIANGAVTSSKIPDFSIETHHLKANLITANEISANAVIAGRIAANAITGIEIKANAISSDKIEANAVVAGKVAANAIDANAIIAGAVTAGKIDSNAVTANNIVANAITSDKIIANAITSEKIAANAITANNISANAVTAGKIDANAITANNITANSITSDKILANAITADKIAANSIDASKVQAFTLTAGQIAAGTIDATRIAANTIRFENLVIGAVTQSRSTISDPISRPIPFFNWPSTGTKNWPDNTRCITPTNGVTIIPSTDPRSSANVEYVEGSRIEVSFSAKMYTNAQSEYNCIELWKSGASTVYSRGINSIRHSIDINTFLVHNSNVLTSQLAYLSVTNTSQAVGYGGINYYSNDGGNTWSSVSGSDERAITCQLPTVSYYADSPSDTPTFTYDNSGFSTLQIRNPTTLQLTNQYVAAETTVYPSVPAPFTNVQYYDVNTSGGDFFAYEKVPSTMTSNTAWNYNFTSSGTQYSKIGLSVYYTAQSGGYISISNQDGTMGTRYLVNTNLKDLYAVYSNKPVVTGTNVSLWTYTVVIVGATGTLVVNPRSFDRTTPGSFINKQLLLRGGEPVITDLYSVASDNTIDSVTTKWVAVGEYGVIMVSTDNGNSWNQVLSPTGDNLQCVRYCNGTWIVVGDNGLILKATDPTLDAGVTNGWTIINAGITDKILTTIDYHEDFDTITIGGQDGIYTTPRSTINFVKKLSVDPVESFTLTRLTYYGSMPVVSDNSTVANVPDQVINNQIYSATVVDTGYVANQETTYYLVLGNRVGQVVQGGQIFLQVTEIKR